MRILVLGSLGFIGSSFIKYCIDNEKCSSNNLIGIDIHAVENNSLEIKYEVCDVTNSSLLKKILKKYNPTHILNCIGLFASNDFDLMLKINVNISQSILEYYSENGNSNISKILLIGSAAEYGFPKTLPVLESDPLNPVNYYGLSKVFQTKLAEFYYENYNIPVVIARPFNIIGLNISDKLAYGSFQKKVQEASNNSIIKTGNLSSFRDYLDVSEVCKMLFTVLFKGASGEIYNICSGKETLTRDILLKIITESGKNLLIEEGIVKDPKADVDRIYGSNKKINDLLKIR